jgi:hypothetical protein
MRSKWFWPAVALAAAALSVPVAAQAATTIERGTLEGSVTLCASGHIVEFSGPLLTISTTTAMPTGGSVTAVHFQPQGITGVDTTTGAVYRVVGPAGNVFVRSEPGVAGSTETLVVRFHLQATGGGESWIFGEVFHLRINPDGSVRAQFDKLSSTC